MAPITLEQIEEVALNLPMSSRAHIAKVLLESLDDEECSSEWLEKMECRSDNIKRGRFISREEAWNKIRECKDI